MLQHFIPSCIRRAIRPAVMPPAFLALLVPGGAMAHADHSEGVLNALMHALFGDHHLPLTLLGIAALVVIIRIARNIMRRRP
jgi:hypothetical protein